MRERDISSQRNRVQGAAGWVGGGGVRASQWETEERWTAEVGLATGLLSANCLGQSSLLLSN